jgi:hypothetical protein
MFSSADAASKLKAIASGLEGLIGLGVQGLSLAERNITDIFGSLGAATIAYYSPASLKLEAAVTQAETNNPHMITALELVGAGDQVMQELGDVRLNETALAIKDVTDALVKAQIALNAAALAAEALRQGCTSVAEHYGKATLEIRQYCGDVGLPEPPNPPTA